MRMKAASKMGLDEAGVRRHNPNVVFSYASAYGQRGARGNWPGYDSIFQAIGGWEVENAGPGNPPLFVRNGTMDVLCALSSLVATLAALYEHEATGGPTSGQASLLGAACLTQSETLIKSDGELAPYPRLDHAQTGAGPLRRIYQTSDGWIAVSATKSGQGEAVCDALGAASILELEAAAKRQTNAALLARLAARAVPAAAVLLGGIDEVFDDSAHRASQVLVGYQHPQDGLIAQPGAYWKFSDAELRLEGALPPPLLGEHTTEILAEIGYSGEEIAALRRIGVIVG
jgi:crotonobetainyl-CoA:carnitine CoA-transferase CaiB-like acyl-CoA transferase